MTQAVETPSLRDDLPLNPHAGGVWRDKVERSTRITPRFSESVSSATGAASWLLGVTLLATFSTACLAADAAPNPGLAPTPAATAAKPPDTLSETAAPPKPWPPPVQLLSPSAALNHKASVSVGLVERWQDRDIKPTLGQRGEVRFIYGATQDTVVCAPLRLCDIALQPGEIVQNVNLGDPTMWSCPPAISGSGASEITHLMCKPLDAGLETSLAIQTSRRSYSINLVSHRKKYMPMVSWSYPEDQAALWSAYQQGGHGHSSAIPAQGYIRYTLTGDNPPWRPMVAYSDGKKTYLHFPPAMAYGQAPVLERLP